MRQIQGRCAVVKPLDQVGSGEPPRNVTFFVDPDRLGPGDPGQLPRPPGGEHHRALGRRLPGDGRAGLPGRREREHPRFCFFADLSARLEHPPSLGPNILSFTAPWVLFQQMEEDAGDCFLQRETWLALRRRPTPA